MLQRPAQKGAVARLQRRMKKPSLTGLRETKRAEASGMKLSEITSEQTTAMQITEATAPM